LAVETVNRSANKESRPRSLLPTGSTLQTAELSTTFQFRWAVDGMQVRSCETLELAGDFVGVILRQQGRDPGTVSSFPSRRVSWKKSPDPFRRPRLQLLLVPVHGGRLPRRAAAIPTFLIFLFWVRGGGETVSLKICSLLSVISDGGSTGRP